MLNLLCFRKPPSLARFQHFKRALSRGQHSHFSFSVFSFSAFALQFQPSAFQARVVPWSVVS
jgi:hypothetical protein